MDPGPGPGVGEVLERLRVDFPCRERQLKTLLGLFGQANHCCFHSLFIYGHPATGKTAVTLAILQALQIPHVFLNCVECFTPRLLFEHILASMSTLGEHGSATENLPRCDNLSEFSRMLHQMLQQLQLHESNVYIRFNSLPSISASQVLDKAEYLKNLDFKVLAVFTRLQELTNCRVAAVLISELVWATFYSGTGCIEPLMLHFPQYNKAELQVILTKDFPNSYSSKFYANFVSILLSVFLPVSRDLRELQHLAALNFSKYCEPITKGQIREDESNKLWRNIEPHLKKAMKTIYLQEVSSLQWEKWQKEGCTMPIKDFSAPVCLELPFYSKFLLIAAYLAAYNPARSDPRFFLKNHGKARKTKIKSKKEKVNNHLLGPKQFPLDRMMAIFHSIVDGHVISSAHISSQISSLVTLRLLSRVTHEDQLDAPKYKCAVTFDTICLIARTVNFDTVKYLFDFV